MPDPNVPNKDSVYRIGPLYMEDVATIEQLLIDGCLVEVKALDTNDAERRDITGAWFEVGDIFLVDETRDKFRVIVVDAALGVGEETP